MSDDSYKTLIDRLSRAEGQIRALKTTLQNSPAGEIDCKQFITQVKAARSALHGVSEQFILKHIHTCQSLPETERDESINEAIKLISGN